MLTPHSTVHLRSAFGCVRVASLLDLQANTRHNIETCGILAGTLHPDEDAFSITSLVIPKQKGEENKVEMFGEEDLCEYIMGKDLMTLGWIHSHPTQTCFLSSIDVHTHFPYQVRWSGTPACDAAVRLAG